MAPFTVRAVVLLRKVWAALPSFRWLLLASMAALWCAAGHFGFVEFLREKVIDWRFAYRGEIASPARLIYVDIDSQALSEIGGFPWSRSYFARTCAALVEHGGVKAIGIDVVFSENGVAEAIDWQKRVNGHREFARYLSKPPPVVLAASYAAAQYRDINGQLAFRQLPLVEPGKTYEDAALPEMPAFRISEHEGSRLWSPGLIGLIDTMHGDTRVVPAYAPTIVRPFLHMSIELARLYFDVPPDGVKISEDHIDLVREDGSLARRIPLLDGQFIEVNWFSAWDSFENPRVSFSTVYAYAEMLHSGDAEERAAAEEFFAQAEFKDAIVLIGPVDPLLQDLATTSFDSMVPVPKVGVHGNMVKTIVSGKFLQRPAAFRDVAWLEHLITMTLSLGVCWLATIGGTRGALPKLAAVLLLVGYIYTAFWIFAHAHYILPITLPVLSAFTTSFVGVIWQLVDEQRQKGRIKGMFGTYVSPALVERMVESGEDPQLGGVEENITAYFSDIQSFSTFSEKLSPPRLVSLMNEYLTACTDIVQSEGGTLDKYIGDAVVAIYGAPLALPDHPLRACVAALRVHRRVAELREKWRHEGDQWPQIVHELQTRIGLNTGPAVVGNMGSQTRFNYTMMGDNVNLAARMESGAKSWGVYTLCTEATKAGCLAHDPERVVFRALGRIVVKGRAQAVPIHEIVALKEDIDDRTRECIALFEQGLERYYARDWEAALALFSRSAALEPNQPGVTVGVTSNPSLVYQRIVEEVRHETLPADWDGVYVMKEK